MNTIFYLNFITITLLQVVEGVDINKMPLYAILMIAIYYLWKSYKESIDRAVSREREVYDKILEKIEQIERKIQHLENQINKNARN